MLRREDKSHVILFDGPPLDEKQIAEILAGNAKSGWYKAIVQMIQELREQNLMAGSRAASGNNQLAMAGALNVYEALSGLLLQLDGYVNRERPQ